MKKLVILIVLTLIPIQTTSASCLEIHNLYLPGKFSTLRTKPITHIMIHSINNAVEKPNSPYQLLDIYQLLMVYGVSTHFLIDRKGEIFRLVPENRVAFHAGRSSLPTPFFSQNMNEFSIGVELMAIGTKDELVPMIPEETYDSLEPTQIGYTEEQYNSLRELLSYIQWQYPTIINDRFHIIGHDDYAPNRKSDPGALFQWSKIGYLSN